jgi:transcriptional regulator with XRE-family HTH domain
MDEHLITWEEQEEEWKLALSIALKLTLREKGFSREAFANAIKISQGTLSHVMSAHFVLQRTYLYARMYAVLRIPEADPTLIPPDEDGNRRAMTEIEWLYWRLVYGGEYGYTSEELARIRVEEAQGLTKKEVCELVKAEQQFTGAMLFAETDRESILEQKPEEDKVLLLEPDISLVLKLLESLKQAMIPFYISATAEQRKELFQMGRLAIANILYLIEPILGDDQSREIHVKSAVRKVQQWLSQLNGN